MAQRHRSHGTLKAISICLACPALLKLLPAPSHAQDEDLLSCSEAVRLADEDHLPRARKALVRSGDLASLMDCVSEGAHLPEAPGARLLAGLTGQPGPPSLQPQAEDTRLVRAEGTNYGYMSATGGDPSEALLLPMDGAEPLRSSITPGSPLL